MLSGICITCFTASYLVALALDATRLLFRSKVRSAVMIAFAGAGLFAHSAFLGKRAINAIGSPLSSELDWCLLAAWVLVAVYLYVTCRRSESAFGVYILPLVLMLIGVATLVADPEPFPREPASKVWGVIHGTSLLLATVIMFLGFVAGAMYVGQAYRLKRKLPPPRRLRLPSLEWLQRINSRAIRVSVLTMGIGVLSGLVLNLINHADRVPWHDPVVVSSMVLFVWLIIAALSGFFYRPVRQGRKVAYLTLASFVFLVIALGTVLLSETQHGGMRNRTTNQQKQRSTADGRSRGDADPASHVKIDGRSGSDFDIDRPQRRICDLLAGEPGGHV